MPLIQLITKKKDCEDCKILKKWLKENHIEFEEWEIGKEEVQEKLENDPNYSAKFCDIESCYPYIPAIRVDKTGKYHFKGLDGIFNIYELQKVIKENI